MSKFWQNWTCNMIIATTMMFLGAPTYFIVGFIGIGVPLMSIYQVLKQKANQ